MILYPNVKLNLGLSVLRKREDGFHDIETLFVPYGGICDRLEIVEAPSFSISIDYRSATPWKPEDDLCARAYELLRKDFPIPPVRISLEKNAPVGAGLGGGSSDAVATLRMLDALFELGLGRSRLLSYAAALGSDCAFFVDNSPAFASGRGEVLEPFDLDLSPYEIRVTVPEGVSVSTAEAYRGVRFHEGMPLREALSRPVEEWKGKVLNDFEPSVFASHPVLEQIKEGMYAEGALFASMSGSGSAIYGMFRREED